MAGTFNSDFYVTAATIIPVLYLALAVQGQTFDAVSGWLYRATLRMPGVFARVINHPRLVRLFKIPKVIPSRTAHLSWQIRAAVTFVKALNYAAVLLFTLLLIGSLIGEIFAILALHDRQSSSWRAYVVLYSVIFLAVIIAIPPIGRLTATFLRLRSIKVRDKQDKERAIRIAIENPLNGEPLIVADYRLIFAGLRTREGAEELLEMNRTPLADQRIGSPTEEEIRKALDEMYPPKDD